VAWKESWACSSATVARSSEVDDQRVDWKRSLDSNMESNAAGEVHILTRNTLQVTRDMDSTEYLEEFIGDVTRVASKGQTPLQLQAGL
jgi:hypothetical protein